MAYELTVSERESFTKTIALRFCASAWFSTRTGRLVDLISMRFCQGYCGHSVAVSATGLLRTRTAV